MSSLQPQYNYNPVNAQRVRDFEVWWKAQPERWPNAPQGHYIGPDGRLLSPVDFAAYAADPSRLVFVFDSAPAGQHFTK